MTLIDRIDIFKEKPDIGIQTFRDNMDLGLALALVHPDDIPFIVLEGPVHDDDMVPLTVGLGGSYHPAGLIDPPGKFQIIFMKLMISCQRQHTEYMLDLGDTPNVDVFVQEEKQITGKDIDGHFSALSAIEAELFGSQKDGLDAQDFFAEAFGYFFLACFAEQAVYMPEVKHRIFLIYVTFLEGEDTHSR